jgi:hypothetical protein
MKNRFILVITLIALLAGCSQGASPEEIAKVAYGWEKAKFNNDYDKQQELIYEEGSYEVDKGAKQIDSGLEYEDIRYEVYYDKKSDQYYVFADFNNPNGENTVEDNIVLRKKADVWKVDTSKSLDTNRDEVKEEFKQEACIHCE